MALGTALGLLRLMGKTGWESDDPGNIGMGFPMGNAGAALDSPACELTMPRPRPGMTLPQLHAQAASKLTAGATFRDGKAKLSQG